MVGFRSQQGQHHRLAWVEVRVQSKFAPGDNRLLSNPDFLRYCTRHGIRNGRYLTQIPQLCTSDAVRTARRSQLHSGDSSQPAILSLVADMNTWMTWFDGLPAQIREASDGVASSLPPVESSILSQGFPVCAAWQTLSSKHAAEVETH